MTKIARTISEALRWYARDWRDRAADAALPIMAAELIDDAVNELKNNTAKLKALREHFHSYDSEPPYPIDGQIRENEALIARAEGGAEPVTEAERAALRAEQAARVMPLIGPLLDAWEGIPNDIRSLVRDEHPELGTHINQIAAAVEGSR